MNERHWLSGRSVSEDSGKTWKEVVPDHVKLFGNGRESNFDVFWSTKKPGILLLAQFGFGDPSQTIVELEIATGNMSLWSKTDGPVLIYAQMGGKLYGMQTAIDFFPNATTVSDDDGKTWKPVAPDETPWALKLTAQRQMDKLVPNVGSQRPYVDWAFEAAGTAFCHVESQIGEKFDPSQPMLFTSTDHGKTWKPAPLDKRTADVATLFAGAPFVGKDPAGKPIIDPYRPFHLEFDAKGQRIFASLAHGEDEWFVTTPSDHEWHRINQAPK